MNLIIQQKSLEKRIEECPLQLLGDNIKYFILLIIMVSFFWSNSLPAKDDLVKLQKKEEKRRKKVKKSVIKITDENINKLSKKSSRKVSKLSGSTSTSRFFNTTPKNSEETQSKEDRKKEYWKSEKKSIENSIKFYEDKVVLLAGKLNKLASDYLIVDFPPSKKQIKEDLDRTRKEMGKSKKQISYFKKKLEDLYERARKESIPPGWLR